MRSKMGISVFFLCLMVVLSDSCRRNQPSLVDANQAPETELWYAPPDSSEYEYIVRIFWRGLDNDGTVVRYIWTITDTIVPGEAGWNPADRLRDFRSGRITTRTDSVFAFSAYRSTGGGMGLKKNRQAFHIAAIDDRGVIDQTPARIEFVATIDELPTIQFKVWRLLTLPTCDTPSRLRKEWQEIVYNPDHPPTVGMYRPFKIVYEGFTENGEIVEYKWFPLSPIDLDGANVWSPDLGDTIRDLPNAGDLALPSKTFRFAVQCRDEAGAESTVDAGRFTEGVCQLVVNFDPQTEIFEAINTYFISGDPVVENVNFQDDIPDTIPYRSWIRLFYQGSNDSIATLNCPVEEQVVVPRDSSVCEDDTNQCIKYQMRFTRMSERFPYAKGRTLWLPPNGEDNNPFGTTDSTSLNIGSVEYEIFVRTVDEYNKPDGTPPSIEVIGNFDPTLDSLYLTDHKGNRILDGDTITWNWWKPVNTDTFNEVKLEFEKIFNFSIHAFGHDSPKEFESGVKTWRYFFYDMFGERRRFARSGSWIAGEELDVLSDTFKVTFNYPPWDPVGDSVFVHLPEWINKTYDIKLMGRDSENIEEFEQYMFIEGEKVLINSYPSSMLGRWTGEETLRFHFRIIRPGF